ncbi:hypothetical protein DFJ73DRAFT_761466 [Zopfochytrium polystomum]|nr:hypothetical protein DFJ73DRAFT_761466 [Zopfochytrium polystomum]
MPSRPSRTFLLAFILPILLALLHITVLSSSDASLSVWAAPTPQGGKLKPTKPLSAGEKQAVKQGIKQASPGQIENSHTGQPKTAVGNLVGRGSSSGFRLDNQGVKNGMTHAAVQRNGPKKAGDRTTVAQAAVPPNSHPSRVQKALVKSVDSGRVQTVKPHDRAQVQRGLDWKQNSGKADRPAGSSKGKK